MEKITEEQFNKLKAGRYQVVKEAMSLEIGEGLKIGFREWEVNYNPLSTILQTGKRHGMKFKTHIDKQNEFWSVLRIQ